MALWIGAWELTSFQGRRERWETGRVRWRGGCLRGMGFESIPDLVLGSTIDPSERPGWMMTPGRRGPTTAERFLLQALADWPAGPCRSAQVISQAHATQCDGAPTNRASSKTAPENTAFLNPVVQPRWSRLGLCSLGTLLQGCNVPVQLPETLGLQVGRMSLQAVYPYPDLESNSWPFFFMLPTVSGTWSGNVCLALPEEEAPISSQVKKKKALDVS